MVLGGLELDNPLLLAPMAGVTNGAVRRLARRLGVGATHTEMVSATGLVRGSKKTDSLLETTPAEEPCFCQFFGGDAEEVAQALRQTLSQRSFAGVSLNMACPMPKVTKRGAGSKLMERQDEALKMVRASSELGLSLWVKIRKCPTATPVKDTIALTEKLLEAGAATVTLHGRTPSQRYDGVNDDDLVDAVAQAFPGRVLVSGDLFTPERVLRALEAGAAGVMLARGFVKDPLLVPESLALLGYSLPFESRRVLLHQFIDDLASMPGPLALVSLKRFAPGLMKGESGVGQMRRALGDVKKFEDVYDTLADWLSCEGRKNDE